MAERGVFLVGAGAIARHHADAALRLPGGCVLHVHDANTAVLAEFSRDYPMAKAHGELDPMLAVSPGAGDVVVVATPPSTHQALAMTALESGRHVLCEKPLAMSVTQARSMIDAAAGAGLELADCSSRFLGLQATMALETMMANGDLGQIYQFTARHRLARNRSGIEYQPSSRWFLDRTKSGGGVAMDWSVYDLAVVFDLIAPKRVHIATAWTARPKTAADPADCVFDVETHIGAAMRLETDKGPPIALNYERASATHGTPGALMEVEGTGGAATLQWLPYPEPETALTVRDDVGGQPRKRTRRYNETDTVNLHHRPLHYFVDRLEGRANRSVAGGACLFNFRVVQGIYQVAERGCPVTIE